MPDISWLSFDEKIIGCGEIAMLEWVHFVKSNYLPQEVPVNMLFTNSLRHEKVRRTQAHLKSSVVLLFLVPDIGDAAAQYQYNR